MERLIVEFAFPSDECWELKPRTINGRDVPQWADGPSMLEFIDRVQREGWRLVSATAGGVTTFERQTPDDN